MRCEKRFVEHIDEIIYDHSTLTFEGGSTYDACEYVKNQSALNVYWASRQSMFTVINFKTSSIKTTGALKYRTAFHSGQFNGVIANRVYRTTMSVRERNKCPTRRRLTVKNGV